MKILFCAAEQTKNSVDLLEKIIKKAAQGCEVLRCYSISDLSARLTSLGERIEIAVLVATNLLELEAYYSIKGLLVNIRIVLILPDQDHETINKAHKLLPRFLTYIDSDPTMVGAVIENMVSVGCQQGEWRIR